MSNFSEIDDIGDEPLNPSQVAEIIVNWGPGILQTPVCIKEYFPSPQSKSLDVILSAAQNVEKAFCAKV
ncbi:hypothetical protein CDAR_232091, partial [Caerostris darwini]